MATGDKLVNLDDLKTLKQYSDAQDSEIKSALGEKLDIFNGSFISNKWSNTNYSMFVKVAPGSPYSIKAGSTGIIFFGLKSATIPPEINDNAVFSSKSGWTSSRSIDANTTETGNIPSDVTVLYFYLGSNTLYSRMPSEIILDGVDIFDSAFHIIKDTLNKAIGNKLDITKVNSGISRIDEQMFFSPYGIEPYQMSLFKKTENLFNDFCYHITGYYYGVQTDSSKHYPRIATGITWQGWLIRVKPNTTYAIGPVDFRIEFTKWDGTRDKQITSVSDSQPNIITSGSESYWMCLTQKLTRDMSSWMMVEGDTYPSSYVSGYPEWVAKPVDPDEPNPNKTVAFMGDSITAGVAAGKCYHQYLHDRYGWTCLNYGYGGAGYYKSYTGTSSGKMGTGAPGMGVNITSENAFQPNNIVARLAEVNPSTTDGIVIFAGTNDWGNNVSVENFISGIESAFTYCKTNFTSIPVLVMTPIHRKNDTVPNSAGKTLREYADIIIDECKKFAMEYVDTMTITEMYPDNAANCALFFPDNIESGLHPGREGHKRLANAIGLTLKNMLNCHNFTD